MFASRGRGVGDGSLVGGCGGSVACGPRRLVELVKGPNPLRFTRQGVPHEVSVKGLTFKEFVLAPMK